MLGRGLEVLFGSLCVIALIYRPVRIACALAFLRQQRRAATVAFAPPVSILKPVRGVEPATYECFRSHCLLDYPEYEIIFGVYDAADPAAEVVRRLQREFPQRRIELVVCSQALGPNRKVSNLIQMLPEARHDLLLVNDGDMWVGSGYLRRVMAPFIEPAVGLVTCIFRARPANTLGSKLEALAINTDFIPGALVALQLERGLRFGLGGTLAFRREALNAIGGFQSLLEYVADDYVLGQRISGAGYGVRLAAPELETVLPDYTMRAFFRHQLRWARTIRDARPGGYGALFVTFGGLWAIAALLASAGAVWAWLLLAGVAVLRGAEAWFIADKVLGDRNALRSLWLLPLSDFMGVMVWLASLAGNTVVWKGERFVLEKGKLRPAS